MPETILVTGGTGKTGSRIVAQLRAKGLFPHVGTRTPRDQDDVRFDWRDATTFDAAFSGIEAVYLVAPTDTVDSLETMRVGLETALSAGIQRFVLLSSSLLEEGGPMMGAVHAWLRDNAPEWSALRPSWFMQNFSELHHRDTIRGQSAIFTATDDGRVGFIDARDIANCATAVLTAPYITNTDYILTGPEAITYDKVAEVMSHLLGRQITHHRLTVDDLAERHRNNGLTTEYAATLAALDGAIAAGSEDRVTGYVLRLTGREPTSLSEFVEQNLGAWDAT